MADLSTTYLGLELKNPLVIAACGLSSTVEGVRKAAEGGAGALVLKSLFEEQLRAELSDAPDLGMGAHPEAAAFLEQMGIRGGTTEYLKLIREAKAVSGAMPIIASINCMGSELWVDYAEQIESAGADALELNISIVPSPGAASKELEDAAVAIVRDVSLRTTLPIAVKLGANFTNPGTLIERMAGAGAKGAVLFNRFYRFDIDLDAKRLKAGPIRSGIDEYHESLRWVANLYGVVACDLAGATGIHSAETCLKFIAAGAPAVQLCSVLYAGGWKVLPVIVDDMAKRLDDLGLPSIRQIQGSLSRRSSSQMEAYERLQYIGALTGIS